MFLSLQLVATQASGQSPEVSCFPGSLEERVPLGVNTGQGRGLFEGRGGARTGRGQRRPDLVGGRSGARISPGPREAEVPGPGGLPVEPLRTGRGGVSGSRRSRGEGEFLGRNLAGSGKKNVSLLFFYLIFIYVLVPESTWRSGKSRGRDGLISSPRLRAPWIAETRKLEKLERFMLAALD